MKLTNKFFLNALSVVLFFAVSSCANDDDGDVTVLPTPQTNQRITSNDLVGDWKAVSLSYSGRSTTNVGGSSLTTNFVATGKNFTYEIIFTDNPKQYTTSGGYTVELTSTVLGNTVTQDVPIPDASTSGTWELNGNDLTLEDNTTNQTNTTEILSAGKNSFSFDYSAFAGQSLGGAAVVLTSGNITFDRK